jgi:diguanylate cyclase (GGDEF)-like protein
MVSLRTTDRKDQQRGTFEKSRLMKKAWRKGPVVKILVAEDESVTRSGIVALLKKWGYEAVETDNGLAAWQALQESDAPRLAVVDWMMPGMDGVQLCRTVRQFMPEPYTYILLLTARNAREDVIKGLDAGADDYVTKPFDVHELQVRLRAGTRILELQDELIAARETCRQQATHDVLTGAFNRRTVLEGLQRELSRAQRDRTPVGVILVDLDHFKLINDTYGHPIGDLVLREAVCRLQRELRSHDLLGRYGGEEFLIVLPGCPVAETVTVAERLRQHLADEPIKLSNKQIFVTGSFGVASSTADGETADALIQTADASLYRAKHEGRNRVVCQGHEVALIG